MSIEEVSDPVCERASRLLAALAPTVSNTVGLPASRNMASVSNNACPSVKLSRYTATTRVASCAARSASSSDAETSDWLPIDTNREIPTPWRAPMVAISVASWPLCETTAMGPGVSRPQTSCSRVAES